MDQDHKGIMIIFANGNFIKIMFLLFSIFFGFIIVMQIYFERTEYVPELVTAMIVFFAFVGRSITEVYKSKNKSSGDIIDE